MYTKILFNINTKEQIKISFNMQKTKKVFNKHKSKMYLYM